ncbi:MAG: hypothetical protein VX564_00545 [Nitrospirota bacterium]|nr:hypothetical protein [Nitrospirota bacterium]
MNIQVRSILACASLGLLFCQILTGCYGSGIQTMIHQDSQSQVYLEWMKKESFQASHPREFSPGLVRKILSGVRFQFSHGFVEKLLRKEAKPVPIFSEEDVEALVPHVVSAMSQVTPEELVVFQRSYYVDSQKRKTTGTIYVKGELLHLTIKELGQRRKEPTITYHKGNRGGEIPDQTGLRDVELSFSPDAVRRQVTEGTSLPMPYSSEKILVLDYKRLLPS